MIASLKSVAQDPEKSGLRILLAIFFWFLAYAAIDAFFTLYAKNHLGIDEANGARLLGQLSLIFIIFALPSGYIAGRIGRRVTIMLGLLVMAAVMLAIYFLPPAILTIQLTRLPVLGVVPVLGVLLMVAGAGWALININSLPMVVDMTSAARIGTYTGLYYLFSTLSAIIGPNLNGLIVQFTGSNYNAIMIVAPFFMLVALALMAGVRRGEAIIQPGPVVPTNKPAPRSSEGI
jgi:MFS family permease